MVTELLKKLINKNNYVYNIYIRIVLKSIKKKKLYNRYHNIVYWYKKKIVL